MPIDRQTNCILELVSTLVHCWKSTATLKVMNLIKIGLPATLRHVHACRVELMIVFMNNTHSDKAQATSSGKL